jgi:hypothetical protein
MPDLRLQLESISPKRPLWRLGLDVRVIAIRTYFPESKLMRYKSKMMSIKFFSLLSLAFSLALVTSCDDWTLGEETECVTVSGPAYWGCLPPSI